MINSVRTAFKENLKDLAWMDEETWQLAQEKADAISDMIGEACRLKDQSLIERYDTSVQEEERCKHKRLRVCISCSHIGFG